MKTKAGVTWERTVRKFGDRSVWFSMPIEATHKKQRAPKKQKAPKKQAASKKGTTAPTAAPKRKTSRKGKSRGWSPRKNDQLNLLLDEQERYYSERDRRG
jgi:hypothetical protein